jgi:uncharacterized membrane protein
MIVGMALVALLFTGVSCGAIYPAFLVSRSQRKESRWLLVAPVPAVVVWGAVTAAGFGAQSLANSVEVFGVFGLGVALAYVKVFSVDKHHGDARVTTCILIILLVVLALVLRDTMPSLPE